MFLLKSLIRILILFLINFSILISCTSSLPKVGSLEIETFENFKPIQEIPVKMLEFEKERLCFNSEGSGRIQINYFPPSNQNLIEEKYRFSFQSNLNLANKKYELEIYSPFVGSKLITLNLDKNLDTTSKDALQLRSLFISEDLQANNQEDPLQNQFQTFLLEIKEFFYFFYFNQKNINYMFFKDPRNAAFSLIQEIISFKKNLLFQITSYPISADSQNLTYNNYIKFSFGPANIFGITKTNQPSKLQPNELFLSIEFKLNKCIFTSQNTIK